MALRVEKQNQNAIRLAQMLVQHPKVRQVYHPSLPEHPQHMLAQNMLKNGYGAILSFRLEDRLETVNGFIRHLKWIRYLGTLGGIRTSITHPLTAFQNAFSPDTLRRMGLSDGLVRVSVGAEAVEDIWGDFAQALEQIP